MTRRRTAAGLAALTAITATLVLGGVTAANADAVIEFTSPGDGATPTWSSNAVTFTGTTTDTVNTITVWDYSSGGSPDPLCVALDSSSGSFTCDASLAPGAKDIRVFQGANSDTVLFTLNLPTQTTTGPTLVPAGGTVNLTGTNAYLGATISAVVTTPNEPGLTCSGTILTGGSWTCDIPFDAELPADSDATATITQTFGSAPPRVTTRSFHVAATPPAAVTLDAPVDGQAYTWSAGTFATINGRAPVGPTVTVSLDGTPIPACTALPVDVYGQWDCGSQALAIGPHTLVAQQGADADTAVVDVRAPAPDVNGLPISAQTDTTYFVGGSGLEGYRVHATLGDAECFGDVTEGGTWSCPLYLGGYAPGGYTLQVEQRPVPESAAINSVTGSHPFTVTPPPAVPALDCTFSPGGGYALSSSYSLDYFELYRIYPVEISSGGSYLDAQGACGGNDGTDFGYWDEFNIDFITDCDCAGSGLEPGFYAIDYQVSDGGGDTGVSFEPHSYVFTIPEAPSITQAVSTTNSVLLRGAASPADQVRVVRPNGSTLCSTTATDDGTWACQFAKSSTASARALSVDPSSGGMSAYSAARAIPVFTPPATITPTTDAPPITLVNWFLEFGGDLMALKPGDSFTLNVSGMPEGTEIEVWMHSTPVLIGTATGTGLPMQLTLTVPEDIESGPHEIEMIGVTPLGTHYFSTSDAMVVGGATPAGDATTDEPGDDAEGGSGGPVDRADPAAPSGITGTLAPLSAIAANPATIAIAGGLALALLFLVALPTELLNSSLSSNTSRLGRAYGAVDAAMTKAQDWLIRVTRSRAIAAGILVVVIAVIYGFVDPGFGFDIVSLRLVLSLAIAFFILSFVASWISGMIIRRAWGAMGVVAMQPSIILFAIVGVIVARVLDFSPGFLVGIAIGLELVAASKTVAARAVFVQLGVVTGLALAAWVVYSLFTPGDDFAGMLVEDTMVAVTAEGLTGALIAVFPLKFLDGRELWEVSKRLWVAAFLIVSVAFALLVLPTAIEGTDVRDYGVWLLVFAVFGLVSLAVWLIFVRAEAKAARAEGEKVDA